MRPVRRDEILDYVTYSERREQLRPYFLEQKRRRRVHIGEHVTLLFENRDTVRYQVQEMMRAEQIVREADIEHELATYNELLGGEGELGCTLLIEVEDAAVRAAKLRAWRGLPGCVYARLEDGTLVRARFDERQMDEQRLSAVQFIKFATGGRVPVAVGIDLPELAGETLLTAEQRAALAEDLAEAAG
ncbi:MAG: DUF3501 family protein [Myxococcales bacterium]|nr:DUF3501 family protein [Myxococcota bacterium]MDW8281574.1 DUF3501 family protein [Myxococcales bacterium]